MMIVARKSRRVAVAARITRLARSVAADVADARTAVGMAVADRDVTLLRYAVPSVVFDRFAR